VGTQLSIGTQGLSITGSFLKAETLKLIKTAAEQISGSVFLGIDLHPKSLK